MTKEVNSDGYLIDEYVVKIVKDNGQVFVGSVNVGNYNRLSDFFAAKDPQMVILYNIARRESKVEFINKKAIKSVQPLERVDRVSGGTPVMDQIWYRPLNNTCQKCSQKVEQALRRMLRTTKDGMIFPQWECDVCAKQEN